MTEREIIVEGAAQKLAALQIQVFSIEVKLLHARNIAIHKDLIEELEGLYIDRNLLQKHLYDIQA